MSTRMRTVAGCLFAALIMTPGLLGQATGTIYGTVYDPSGAVLPGATIAITNEGTNQMRTVQADGAGKFVAPLLPAGTYRVRIDHSGFSSFVQHGVTLEADTTVQVPVMLQLTATAQNLVVNANATLVQANSTNLVQVVDQRRIEDLPLNGRNVLQLMALDAGISETPTRHCQMERRFRSIPTTTSNP
jgi:Carboxypeptidase regulatory-like domain